MEISINRSSSTPIYVQITKAIEGLIWDGTLPKGTKLPSERMLADELGVHRNTIIKAYGMLMENNLVFSSRKRPMGYFIKDAVESDFSKKFFPLEKPILFKLRESEQIFADSYWDDERQDLIHMSGIVMDKTIGPTPKVDNVLDNVFDSSGYNGTLSYQKETELLKSNICNLLSERGIRVEPSEVQLVSETNHAVNYLINLYLRFGDVVIVEEPIVPDMSSLFENKGITLISVPMDYDGINLEAFEDAVMRHKPKFFYTIPTYHNPTGITMSLEKRYAVLNITHRYKVPIIEDDYQNSFGYSGEHLPCLFTLDNTGSVIYLDSFTMAFPYGAKIGYMIGPEELIEKLGYIISIDETYISNLSQYFINEYIRNGGYEEHMRRACSVYRDKMMLLTRELEKCRSLGISYYRPKGGVVLWCTIASEINGQELYKTCLDKGLIYMPGWIFYSNQSKGYNKLRLCISRTSNEEIIKGVSIIKDVLENIKK